VILVDTNVIIDILERDRQWFAWSSQQLADAVFAGDAAVNLVVLAESAPRFAGLEEQLAVFTELGLRIDDIDHASAFAAGQRFRAYRAGSSDRTAILADFLIGAHALERSAALLTRDSGIYRRHFPELTLITPESL